MIIVVFGMQFGSEGKGKVANLLCHNAQASVRVGGINAGHTLYFNGQKYAMQTIPVGWTNPRCQLYIGAGALINMDILNREINMVNNALGGDVRTRLRIDPAVGIIEQSHMDEEANAKLNLHNGSTCKGVGAATAQRAWRKLKTAQDIKPLEGLVYDTVTELNALDKVGAKIVIEGTQGYGLSLTTGRIGGRIFYPKCSSRDVTPAAIIADCGIGSKHYYTLGVMRSFPIRVGWEEAGDFGSRELTWEYITKQSGSTVPITEQTTVTKRTRRVAENNLKWMREVAEICNVDGIAYTFADYHNVKDYGVIRKEDLSAETTTILNNIEFNVVKPMVGISTGEQPQHFIKTGDLRIW